MRHQMVTVLVQASDVAPGEVIALTDRTTFTVVATQPSLLGDTVGLYWDADEAPIEVAADRNVALVLA